MAVLESIKLVRGLDHTTYPWWYLSENVGVIGFALLCAEGVDELFDLENAEEITLEISDLKTKDSYKVEYTRWHRSYYVTLSNGEKISYSITESGYLVLRRLPKVFYVRVLI